MRNKEFSLLPILHQKSVLTCIPDKIILLGFGWNFRADDFNV